MTIYRYKVACAFWDEITVFASIGFERSGSVINVMLAWKGRLGRHTICSERDIHCFSLMAPSRFAIAALSAAAVAAIPHHARPSSGVQFDIPADLRQFARPGRSMRSGFTPEPPAHERKSSRVALRGLTDSSVFPAPVSLTHASTGDFKFFGSNVAATSPDCPFLAHGPGNSLDACEAACGVMGSCNVINWNPSIGDCVFRSCNDPMAPTLTPTTGYSVYGVLKAAYALNPSTFAFVASGRNSAVLTSAMARYKPIAFVYGSGSRTETGAPAPVYEEGSLLPGGILIRGSVAGLTINVTSDDVELREGVDESYTLNIVNDDAEGSTGFASTLIAPTVFGALRGLETFAQLVQWNASSGAYSIQATAVADAPRFPFRGVLLDLARHYIPFSQMRATVDYMAYLKLNALHLVSIHRGACCTETCRFHRWRPSSGVASGPLWPPSYANPSSQTPRLILSLLSKLPANLQHLSDDQSFPLEITSYPRLTSTGVFSNISHVYRQDDMRAFVAYAWERGVRVRAAHGSGAVSLSGSSALDSTPTPLPIVPPSCR